MRERPAHRPLLLLAAVALSWAVAGWLTPVNAAGQQLPPKPDKCSVADLNGTLPLCTWDGNSWEVRVGQPVSRVNAEAERQVDVVSGVGVVAFVGVAVVAYTRHRRRVREAEEATTERARLARVAAKQREQASPPPPPPAAAPAGTAPADVTVPQPRRPAERPAAAPDPTGVRAQPKRSLPPARAARPAPRQLPPVQPASTRATVVPPLPKAPPPLRAVVPPHRPQDRLPTAAELRLEDLARRHRQGLISDEEYAGRKQAILDAH